MKHGLFDLSGRVAIVTGGNGGIGLGMARGLAASGAAVAIVGRNETKSAGAVADLTKDGHKAIAVAADVTDEAAVTAMVERVRRERGGGVTMQTTDRPREIVIHQSANRPNQILGGDRELVLIAMLTAISLAFSLGSWWGIGLSVAFWVGAVAVLQRMGKADPLLRHIYVRHIRYKAFYPAKSGLLSRCASIPRNWR